MKDFVEECRREWKRLRVPDPVADEMAADLAADLEEAEAEGASAEEVLGSGAFDARSFAAAWAAERGVGRPRPSGGKAAKRTFLLAAIAALVVIAVSGAVLRAVEIDDGPLKLALFPPPPPTLEVRATVWVSPVGGPADAHGLHASVSGVDTGTVGSILLIVGLAGSVLLTLFWLWVSRRNLRAETA